MGGRYPFRCKAGTGGKYAGFCMRIDAEADAVSLGERIPATPLVAFGYMGVCIDIFSCIATLAAIKGGIGQVEMGFVCSGVHYCPCMGGVLCNLSDRGCLDE